MVIYAWIAILAGFAVGGCSDKYAGPVPLFHEYFPATQGHFVVYRVDSVFFDDFTQQIKTFQYQVKERVHSTFVDGEDHESIRIERFIRQTPQQPWVIKDIWHARVGQGRAVRYEENIPFIKLVFPPDQGRRWNGNAFNHLSEMTFKITEAHQPSTLSNGLSFDSTITVMQNNFITLISEDIRWEKYALHVGLIERRYRSVSKNLAGAITAGVDYTYTILAFGRE